MKICLASAICIPPPSQLGKLAASGYILYPQCSFSTSGPTILKPNFCTVSPMGEFSHKWPDPQYKLSNF